MIVRVSTIMEHLKRQNDKRSENGEQSKVKRHEISLMNGFPRLTCTGLNKINALALIFIL